MGKFIEIGQVEADSLKLGISEGDIITLQDRQGKIGKFKISRVINTTKGEE